MKPKDNAGRLERRVRLVGSETKKETLHSDSLDSLTEGWPEHLNDGYDPDGYGLRRCQDCPLFHELSSVRFAHQRPFSVNCNHIFFVIFKKLGIFKKKVFTVGRFFWQVICRTMDIKR